MLKIALIGSGNLGSHLFAHWQDHPSIEIMQWVNRSIRPPNVSGTSCISTIDDLQAADAYILAVPDRSIPSLSNQLPQTGMAIHCSGSVPLSQLKNQGDKAVLYPLQTFSKTQKLIMNEVPLFLEIADGTDSKTLHHIANSWSPKQYWIDSKQRQQLHLAAVFANNFTNQLYHIAGDICQRNQLPFDVLQPLIQETAQKIASMTPTAAQTGPAKRNDQETIDKHLNLLSAPLEKQIYVLLSQAILNQHHE